MEQKHGKKTKSLNLVTSILVTAVCILVWHFILPFLGEPTNLVKLISYGILLFDTLWITDAALAFWKAPTNLSEHEKLFRTQTLYALVGLSVFLLYAALAHAVVAVFDGNNTNNFMISGFTKSGLALVGFSLLLTNSLQHTGRRLWTILSGVATFAVGIIFSTFLNLDITIIIMCGVVAIYLFADVFMICKKVEVSPLHFALASIVYIVICAAVLLIVHFIPIHFGNSVVTFLIRGVENLAFAIIVDVLIVLAQILLYKKKKTEKK